mgnify:CR=1 FL=1
MFSESFLKLMFYRLIEFCNSIPQAINLPSDGLTELNRKMTALNQSLDLADKIITYMTFISGGMLTIAALLIGVAIWFVVRKNGEISELNEKSKSDLDEFIKLREAEVRLEISKLKTDSQHAVERFRRTTALIHELNNTNPRRQKIRAFVDYLAPNPYVHERGLFEDVIKLNLGEEINERCEQAIETISKNSMVAIDS